MVASMQEQNLVQFSAPRGVEIDGLRDSGVSGPDLVADSRRGHPTEVGMDSQRSNFVTSDKAVLGGYEQAKRTARHRAHRAWSAMRIGMVFTDLVLLIALPAL